MAASGQEVATAAQAAQAALAAAAVVVREGRLMSPEPQAALVAPVVS